MDVRKGGLDCTMYGGRCGAGTNNYFFSNGNVYYCGNCIDLPPVGKSDMSFEDLEKISLEFNRDYCYKEHYENRTIRNANSGKNSHIKST